MDDLDLLAPRVINTCQNCARTFTHAGPRHQCGKGHAFCSFCISDEFSSCSSKFCLVSQCGSEIRLDKRQGLKERGKIFTKCQRINTAALVRSRFLKLHQSKRPVICPYPGCGKCVGGTNFGSHFRYEHEHVTLVNTCFEARNATTLYLDEVHNNQCLCIALFNTVDQFGKLIRFDSYEPNVKRPFILAMAIRISDCKDEETIRYDIYCNPKEIIFLWLASSISTTYKYTIVVSKIDQMVRLKYHGPISTLDENCFQLYEEGRGLIMSSDHIHGMNEVEGISLDIVLHDEQD